MQSYTVIIGVLEMREKHFSYRDIRSRYGIGQGTVKLIIDRANEIGLPLADIRQMEPEKVETAFYPPENIRRKEIPLPDYQLIYDRLTAKGSKANLFYQWVDYKKDNPDGYQYTQFVHYFHDFVKQNYGSEKVSMPVERIPGERVYIDWVGDKPELVVDPETGEIFKVHVFVTTVGVSSCIYAEIFPDERMANFIAGTVHALDYYKAVPKYLVPDNCKTAVTKHTKDEIIINAREDNGELIITVDREEFTREKLGAMLERMVRLNPDQPVRIRGDAQMTWQMMADVITTCTKAGISQVSFSKQMPKEGQ